MKKRYSLLLTKGDYNKIRNILLVSEISYEPSSCGEDIYLSMNLDEEEVEFINSLVDNYL